MLASTQSEDWKKKEPTLHTRVDCMNHPSHLVEVAVVAAAEDSQPKGKGVASRLYSLTSFLRVGSNCARVKVSLPRVLDKKVIVRPGAPPASAVQMGDMLKMYMVAVHKQFDHDLSSEKHREGQARCLDAWTEFLRWFNNLVPGPDGCFIYHAGSI